MPMTTNDIAWAAGFLDGEGSFVLVNYQDKGISRRRTSISADQILREPLDKLVKAIGGSVSGPIRNTSAGNPIYRWVLRGNAITALEALIPHLTVKKERAELLLRYARTQSRRRIKTPEELRIREEVVQEWAALAGLRKDFGTRKEASSGS